MRTENNDVNNCFDSSCIFFVFNEFNIVEIKESKPKNKTGCIKSMLP